MKDTFIPFQNKLMGLPYWWFDAFFGFVAAFGVLMWLFGRKMIRQALTVTGLLIGAVAGFSLAQIYLKEWNPLWWMLAAAVVAGIASYCLYRIAMSAIIACSLALLSPWAVAAWQNIPMPQFDEPIRDISQNVQENIKKEVETIQAGGAPGDGETWFETLGQGVRQLYDVTGKWWEATGPDNRMTLGSMAVGGAVVGVAIGLLFPNFGAMLVTSFAGVVMMGAAFARLAIAHAPGLAEYAPSSSRTLLICLMSMTAAGLFVQWRMFRQRPN